MPRPLEKPTSAEELAQQAARKSSRPNISTKKDDVVLSPYVIHLSRNDAEVKPAAPHLDALAHLLEQAESFDEETAEETLSVHFEQLSGQLSEPETHPYHSTASTPQETQTPQEAMAPMSMQLEPHERVDVYRSIMADLPRVEAPEPAPVTKVEAPEPAPVTKEVHVDEPKKQKPAFSLPTFSLPFFEQAHVRAIAAFSVIALAIVMPLHALQGVASTGEQQVEITHAGQAALDNFLRATTALEYDKFDIASNGFDAASDHFSEAEASLKEMNILISTALQVLPQTDKSYDSVSGLLTAGASLTQAASQLASGAEHLSQQSSTNVVTKLRQLSTYVEAAMPDILTAEQALQRVDADYLPEEYAPLIDELLVKAPAIAESMQEFLTFSDTLAILLGDNEKMRYLVVFQNDSEARGSGGFIGSFSQIDVLNGEITAVNTPAGGSYDVQGQLAAFLHPPQPLSLINPRWEFHDANWSPDFPTTAEKLLWFYREAGGPTLDGVMAINSSVLPELLGVLGPVDMPEYGRTITAENVLFETQKIVEIEYEQFTDADAEREEEAPKQFIGDLAPILLERIESAETEQLLAIVDILGQSLHEKDVQLYFTDNQLQSHIESIGWSGKLKQTSGDYLMVVNSNLGGGKTDNVIDQTVDVDVEIRENGKIRNTVTITKQHRGIQTSLFEGVNNVDYLRIYVPRGSHFIDGFGFEIPPEDAFETSDLPLEIDEDHAFLLETKTTDPLTQTDIWEEQGKTVFGNWMQTAPGETEQISFTYELPFSFNTISSNPTLLEMAKTHLGFKQLETYTMLVQKQSGVSTRETHVTIDWPEQSTVVWTSAHEQAETLSNDTDHFLRFLVENR